MWGGGSVRLYGSNDVGGITWSIIPIWHDTRVDRTKIQFEPQSWRWIKIEFSNLQSRVISDILDPRRNQNELIGRVYNAYPPVLLDEFRARAGEQSDDLIGKVESFAWDEDLIGQGQTNKNGSTAGWFADIIRSYITNHILTISSAVSS